MIESAPPRDASVSRRLLFGVIALVTLGAAGAYVAVRARQARPHAAGASAASTSVGEGPRVLFRNLSQADGSFGQVGQLALGVDAAERSLASLSCVRLHYAAGRGLCLEGGGSLTEPATLRTFGSDFTPRWTLPLSGLPSRARVSPHGRYGAITVFVTGHGYNDVDMSTQTLILDLEKDAVAADLESFEVTRDGAKFSAPDFNFWGVTFASDDDRFYATLASGKSTWLVEGRVSEKRVSALRENAECPSLSPDDKRLAYKKRTSTPGEWRLHVLDIASGSETPVAEERSIDDQVEWLDETHILYKNGPSVFSIDVTDGSPAKLFLDRAASPAVVRH
ncbi:MAG: hypothetical protein HOV80_02740 [Polyangiaceae bacterium]|nr:hypothetical protein [Polyangiaceae bacterium]